MLDLLLYSDPQGDIGLNVAKMIAELIRDNRKIVDRISQEQIELFVGLLKINKVTGLALIKLVRNANKNFQKHEYLKVES